MTTTERKVIKAKVGLRRQEYGTADPPSCQRGVSRRQVVFRHFRKTPPLAR
jgi:hypothetical protein